MQIRSGYEIAVVGLGGRFPGAETISQFWEILCLGKDSISPSNSTFGADESEAHWVETPQFLKDAYHFDASFFGMRKGVRSNYPLFPFSGKMDLTPFFSFGKNGPDPFFDPG